MKKKVSLIIPVYNEEKSLYELYRRLDSVMNQIEEDTECIFINDGSKDSSLSILRKIHKKDTRIRYISLARNFGHQIAVTAGLNFSQGDSVIILDGDLQDPPELILDMLKKWKESYQVVYAQRTKRKKENWFKRLSAFLYYRVLKNFADIDIPTDTGDFCLMDRTVVDVLNEMPERNRYVRGLRAWIGFRQTAIPFEREARFAGEVKYTFFKSLSLALNGLVSFSRLPLRLSTYIGILSALLSVFMIFWVLYFRISNPNSSFSGYAIIMIVVFFFGAVQLVSVGILGEYIGRIYEEVKNRPLYIISEIVGLNKKNLIKK